MYDSIYVRRPEEASPDTEKGRVFAGGWGVDGTGLLMGEVGRRGDGGRDENVLEVERDGGWTTL